MTNKLRIPANTHAYLIASHDEVDGSFNVRKFAYGYPNDFVAGPWAYWKMEEEGLETRVDSSGNGHHLLIDTELLEPGEDFDRVTGKVGYGMEYVPHYGAYADETHVDWDGDELGIGINTQFAFAFWFKPHLISNPASYVEFYAMSYALYFIIGFDHDNPNAYIYAGSSGWMIPHMDLETAGIFAPDVWHFVVWQFDGTGMFLYVDNVLRDSALGTDNGVNGSNWWYMGGVYEDEMSIALDEFGIWVGTSLSETERATLWNNGNGTTLY